MFNNLNATLKKIMVVFLIITLTYANLVLIGSNIVGGLILYAAQEGEENVSPQNNEENTTEGEEGNLEETEEESILVLNIENKDIHKKAISEDGQAEYTKNIKINLNEITDTSKIIVEDILNEFYNNDETINEDITLKYKTTAINKEALVNLLGTEGKLVITDAVTNKVLVELTNDLLSLQELDVQEEQVFIINEETNEEETRSILTVKEETVEIEYVLEIEKIKFELTNIIIEESENTTENKDENVVSDESTTQNDEVTENESEIETQTVEFIIENIKTISNISNIEDLDYLKEDTKYFVNEEEQTTNNIIKFKDTITRANLTVDNTEWVLGQANTVKYTIELDTTTEKSEMFVNPMFLIELPSSVDSVDNANSEFSIKNDNGAFTSKRVFVTTVLGRKFVVITLEGEQTEETVQNGNATIDLTLNLNIAEKATEGNEITKLYYQNDTVTAYESGKGFDTAQVTVSMIMASEPKDEIEEKPISNISLTLSTSTQDILTPGDELEYNVYLYNFSNQEKQNLIINDVLPEGVTLKNVVELVDNEEIETNYEYDNDTRDLNISIDKLGATYEKEVEMEGQVLTVTEAGTRMFKIIVTANELENGIYSKEIQNKATVLESGNIIYETAKVVNTISDVILEIKTENLESINEEEEINLELRITNKGLIDGENINIEIEMPEVVSLNKYNKIVLSEDGEEQSKIEGTLSDADYATNISSIQSQKTFILQLIGKVGKIEETKQVVILGTANGEEFTWTVNLVDLTVDSDQPTVPDTPTDPENPVNPDGPAKPENPEEPTEPENPEKPGSTDEPENENFDLSLNQYLNKVTVVNSKGTTTYDYKDTNFAKIEIHSKQMNGSKVTLEYNIVVKNEGTLPGYARKIVDYIPSDLTFNNELNPDWYLGEDGNIYSVALIDKLLNPGETVEVKVILEKQMTNENIGTITNLVEIYEASNSENVEDINSIPGDKLDGQNDMSKVEVMVVTSTGTIILYTTLIIAVITILGFGFYRVKKVTLNNKGGC